jgi:hypothetical protein
MNPAVIVIMWPLHVISVGIIALLCQDAWARRQLSIRSLFLITTVIAVDLALMRLVSLLGQGPHTAP